jgi:hypothetical protein
MLFPINVSNEDFMEYREIAMRILRRSISSSSLLQLMREGSLGEKRK